KLLQADCDRHRELLKLREKILKGSARDLLWLNGPDHLFAPIRTCVCKSVVAGPASLPVSQDERLVAHLPQQDRKRRPLEGDAHLLPLLGWYQNFDVSRYPLLRRCADREVAPAKPEPRSRWRIRAEQSHRASPGPSRG